MDSNITYTGSDEERPLEGINFGLVISDALKVLHLVDKVGSIVRLHIKQYEPEVDSDTAQH
jgi:hypothetical protein